MAALPVTLIDRRVAAMPALGAFSPVRLSLVIDLGVRWPAAPAAAVLLHGVLALSERRAAFVSAVTHELRTPLTTFRMYAEMFAEGMVPGEADRPPLSGNAATPRPAACPIWWRTCWPIARLDRGGPAARIGPVPVGQLLDRAGDRLPLGPRRRVLSSTCQRPDEVLAAAGGGRSGRGRADSVQPGRQCLQVCPGAEDRTLRLEAA